jgi:hypothetical protein
LDRIAEILIALAERIHGPMYPFDEVIREPRANAEYPSLFLGLQDARLA